MNPVRSIKNQYPGINAHLHSYWQVVGGWDEFHMSHIVHLANGMRSQLRPMGYSANIKQSLQIRRFGEPAGKPESDVTIYDTDPLRQYMPFPPESGGTSLLVMTIPEILNLKQSDVEQYRAVGIYRFASGKRDPGEPVAWIELLSPSNKPGGQDANYYVDRRLKILQSGIVFVEIDYLHESPPTFASIPNYLHQGQQPPQSGSSPYRIIVIDPRPEFLEGQALTHQFHIDERIPVIEIPLNGGDRLTFDFGAPYQKTFEEGFFGDEVDYSQLPLNFERYSAADQQRIAARMLAVLEAAQAGIDLETASISAKNLPLDEALKQIETLVKG